MLKGILTKEEICNERAPILWFPPHMAAVAAQTKMRSLELHPSLQSGTPSESSSCVAG